MKPKREGIDDQAYLLKIPDWKNLIPERLLLRKGAWASELSGLFAFSVACTAWFNWKLALGLICLNCCGV